MNQLARKTANGAAINIAVTVSKTALQFIVVLPILARVLTPEDFGLVAMAMAFVAFFTMFNDLGISVALVRADSPSPEFWSSAFWTNLALGAVLTILVLAAAPWIAGFFSEPVVEPLVRGLSSILLMHCIFLVPMAWLQRSFRFQTIAFIDLTATIISAAVAVLLGLHGFGVWALIWQQIVLYLVKMIGGLICHKAPIRPVYKAQEIINVLPFSLGLTGTAFVAFVNRNADNILIGRFMGSAALGFYGRAYQMMLMPVNSLGNAASFALYPAMAEIKHDRPRLADTYLKSLSALSIIIFPMMTGLSIVSESFIALMFGPQWEAVAPVLKILAFVGIIQSIRSISSVLWKAAGRADILLKWALIRAFVFVGAFLIGIHIGTLSAMASAFLIANIVLFFPFHTKVLRHLNLDFGKLWTALAPQTVSTFVMAISLLSIQTMLPNLASLPSYTQLLIMVPVGIITYGLALGIGFRSFVDELISDMRALFFQKSVDNGS